MDQGIQAADLGFFSTLASAGSLSAAARELGITTPAVSRRLAQMEARLGVGLVNRTTRRMGLTPEGELYLAHARRILGEIQDLGELLGASKSSPQGLLRVNATLGFGRTHIAPLISRFVRQHPEVKIDLEEHLSSDVLRAVQEGAADIGICNASAATASGHALQVQPYREDHLALIVPAAHALSAQAAINFIDSLDFDHVGLQANSSIALAMHQAAAEAGRAIRLRIRVTGLDAMGRMIANGLGVGVMPARAFELMQPADGPLRAVPLNDDWARRDISLIARDFATLPATARALVEHLRAAIPALPELARAA